MIRKKKLDSGIYMGDGSGHYRNVDVMTELSGREFKKWLLGLVTFIGIKGFINIKSHDILDGYDLSTDTYSEKRKYEERINFTLFIEKKGVEIRKDEKKWRKFLKKVRKM